MSPTLLVMLLSFISQRSGARRALAIATAATASLVCAATAHAGTYQVLSCDSATPGGADNAWVYETTNAVGYEQVPKARPPASSDRPSNADDPSASTITGLAAWTHLNTAVGQWPKNGEYMQYALTAPSGTSISAVTITRSVGKDDQGYTVYGRADGSLINAAETCSINVGGGYFTCDTGGGAYTGSTVDPRVRTPVIYSGLNASKIAWGVECPSAGSGTGATLHSAWVAIYASTTTINDPTVPTAAGLTIPGSGWRRATISGTGSGTDTTGIRGFRWYVDGSPLGSEFSRTGACDYTKVAPCTNATSDSVSLDTALLSDGSHSVKLAAIDAGGNQTQSSATVIQVDNIAPAAPTALNTTGGGSSSAFSATWTNPAADSGSPYASSAWQACVGGDCTSGTGGLNSASGTLPAGTGTLKVWLVDSAGNTASSNAASTSFTNTPSGRGGGRGPMSTPAPTSTSAPGPAPEPTTTVTPTPSPAPTLAPRPDQVSPRVTVKAATLSRTTGQLSLTATAVRAFTGRVSVRVRARVRGEWQTTTQEVAVRRGTLRTTVYIAAAWARSASSVKVTITWPGNSMFRASTDSRTCGFR